MAAGSPGPRNDQVAGATVQSTFSRAGAKCIHTVANGHSPEDFLMRHRTWVFLIVTLSLALAEPVLAGEAGFLEVHGSGYDRHHRHHQGGGHFPRNGRGHTVVPGVQSGGGHGFGLRSRRHQPEVVRVCHRRGGRYHCHEEQVQRQRHRRGHGHKQRHRHDRHRRHNRALFNFYIR
jgi:hypothetical protein